MAAELRENWMVMLLKDLLEVARRENLEASSDALVDAIDALRLETAAPPAGGNEMRRSAGGDTTTRH